MTRLQDHKAITALARKAAETTGKVMVVDGRGNRRHLRLYSNGSDVWVRTGKRGQSKRHLTEAHICCKNPLVVVFKEGTHS